MDLTRTVECDRHGPQVETFVCQHILQTLRDHRPTGFCWSVEDSKARPDAWCLECDRHREATGGDWTGENEKFADISLICGACYDEVKRLNGF